ncbi:MAG: hypothetical protein PHQ81_08950 [Methanofollis sp.]|nr:hypothetical protein [Methanofollis sp.]
MKCYEILCKAIQEVPAVENLSLVAPWGEGTGLIGVSRACTLTDILIHGTWDERADTLTEAGAAVRSLEAEHPDIEDVFLPYSHATEEAA